MNNKNCAPPEFDIVICVGPHDTRIIGNMLEYTKRNIIGYNNIFLITCAEFSASAAAAPPLKDCIIVDEKLFPFKKNKIAAYLQDKTRTGWYYQQLLKLYAWHVIPTLNNYLVIDADTFFLKPTEFFTPQHGHPIYNICPPNNTEYFAHMKRMHPSLKPQIAHSGVANYMMFQRKYVNELFTMVETYHNKKFYKVFMDCIDPAHEFAGASEYETYLTFMIIYHPTEFNIAEIKNDRRTSLYEPTEDNVYINLHWYNRTL